MITTEFKAFDVERKAIVDVLKLTFETTENGIQHIKCRLNNGYVSYYKFTQNGECILLPYTDYLDKDKKNKIYLDDLLQNENGDIFRVVWNRNQTQYWLNPVKIIPTKDEDSDDILSYAFRTQPLGNGYFNRQDLEKVGNYYTDKDRLLKTK